MFACTSDMYIKLLLTYLLTTGTPVYYVDEDYPAGPGITGITEHLPE